MEDCRIVTGSDVMNEDCSCHDSKLNIKKLCAYCAKVCWLKSKQIMADEVIANKVCTQELSAKTASNESLSVNNLCAVSANINDLCVTNLRAPNWRPCNTRRSYVARTADYLYTLGNDIEFDAVLDNPAPGIYSPAPSKFTAPTGGYYEYGLFINAFDLNGTTPITGTPVAKLSVYVNAVSRQSTYVPLLSFVGTIKAGVAADLLLQAGDIVTAQLDILVLDAVGGLTEYVGTMMIKGGALVGTDDPSTMSILLKTELCDAGPTPIPCITCEPVTVDCERVEITGCERTEPV
jgi:hypothetical protein